MGTLRYVALLALLTVTACAGPRTATGPSEEYVEVDNPAYTMSPNASPTMWVPRRYVESGIPRGSQLVKKGYEEVVGKGAPAPASQVAAAVSPRLRIAVVQAGGNELAAGLGEKLRGAGFALVGEPRPEGALSVPASVEERGAYVQSLNRNREFNAVVFIGSLKGEGGGSLLVAEMYDGMGGILLRRIEVPVSSQGESAASLDAVADKVRGVARHIPWLCGIAAVEGEKVYINAGRESGVVIGQRLRIYRGGKGIKGLGFDPGSKVGTLEVTGFVGPNGAYGIVREGEGARTSDLVGSDY
ncbi:hypothetical protein GeomeDRAFT_1676 [Geobacter metallireducens RCH3]|uniref:Lipoprotein, putative n=1 Tax=Geobacter metallireducens (strain ATCC 53774 / DSM 7210 / GS-15) TaxID=269799 RepID=Q39TP6_GEOMG|nr:hypothetical protein [Geobacter metallireducens]ABB32378.1 lipoprotein, putative [Geobacter metallireducens GS-15]EHP86732.1 hypothetical protein GeomeDRAFT_1676 [Geobacter metallireducens RCH3]